MSLFGKSSVQKTDITKRYNLIGRVGQGSMSKVWRAEDKMSGNFVAVKVLDKEKTKRFEERFKGLNKPTEADIAGSLKHPYIVKTLEIGTTQEDEPFLVMDYVEGSGLSLLVDLQSEDMRQYRIRYMIQIGEALSYFHQQGFIHRDICPRNIMVTDDHKIRLIDFGLAVPDQPEFKKPGNRTGTANYMAPELIKRRPTDQRIDVFAYAVTCFEMYAKRHPWDAAQTLDAVMQHINQPPEPLSKLVPRIDEGIATTIMKGLERDPNDRWQTIDEMVKAFREAEVRLVKTTRELLARRKQKAGGGSVSGKPAAPGKKEKPTQKTAADNVEKQKTKETAQASDSPKPPSTATTKPKSAAKAKSPDSGKPAGESRLVKKSSKPAAKTATAPRKEKPIASPDSAAPPVEDSITMKQSDDDILALPDD